MANKLEELKKAEVNYFVKSREPDYSKNEFVLNFFFTFLTNDIDQSFCFSEFNYTQWESKEVFEQRFLEKLDDEQVKSFSMKLKFIQFSLFFL